MSRAFDSLSDQVDQAIQNNPYLLGRTLRFETHGDRVVLKGIVGSYFQKQMAQEGLRHIDGVAQIENHLEVATS
jgi:osmotically-inducible protein OsmY